MGLRSDSAWENDPLRRPGSACWSLCPSYPTSAEWHAALRGAERAVLCCALTADATCGRVVKGGLLPARIEDPYRGEAGRGPTPSR